MTGNTVPDIGAMRALCESAHAKVCGEMWCGSRGGEGGKEGRREGGMEGWRDGGKEEGVALRVGAHEGKVCGSRFGRKEEEGGGGRRRKEEGGRREDVVWHARIDWIPPPH